jgi:uncharacterized membrane protein
VKSRLKSNGSNEGVGTRKLTNHSPERTLRSAAASDRTVQAVAQVEREAYEARSRVDRLATSITRKAGSGTTIVLHLIWFAVWIAINIRLFGVKAFDPFPFSLLTTLVSLEAIFLTLFVLVSQNRMSREADKRAELDLQINVLAEREATMILRILSDISSHLNLTGVARTELAELLKETKIQELSRKLEKALPSDE